MAEILELKPARGARGTVRLPGSKSISNRVLLLAALAQGETEIAGLLDADDTKVMREALAVLGVAFTENHIRGVGGAFPVRKADLFLGNAGTAFRPLTAALAFSAVSAAAQEWPHKPVRLVLSLGPGSGADIGARLYADRLTKLWGQPVVVENKPGDQYAHRQDGLPRLRVMPSMGLKPQLDKARLPTLPRRWKKILERF